MPSKIVIIDGHPDKAQDRYCHALAESYTDGALEAGHEVSRINIAEEDIRFLRSQRDFESAQISTSIEHAQKLINAADHLVIVYPLWLGSMPALLKAFMEQVFRPGFAFIYPESSGFPRKLLKNKSCRVIVTMGMPAMIYRFFYLSHSLRSLERNILSFVGIGPVKESLIGMVDAISDDKRKKWLEKIKALGHAGK